MVEYFHDTSTECNENEVFISLNFSKIKVNNYAYFSFKYFFFFSLEDNLKNYFIYWYKETKFSTDHIGTHEESLPNPIKKFAV